MKQFEIVMPKMGESVEEATITKWFVKPGDVVKEDDILLEIATDKVDSEIPSPVHGIVKELLHKQDETVPVGTVIALIEISSDQPGSVNDIQTGKNEMPLNSKLTAKDHVSADKDSTDSSGNSTKIIPGSKNSGRFYSPLVLRIAKEENINLHELDSIKGTGYNGRLKKNDLINYLRSRNINLSAPLISSQPQEFIKEQKMFYSEDSVNKPFTSDASGDLILEMDRVRKIIADRMIKSIQVSAHVTNIIEVDVTSIVTWRNKIKDEFEKKEGQKITYLPIFLEMIIKGLKDFPMMNSSVEGDRIIVKKRINLGIAVALPNYNLIVPVIKNADHLSLTGLTRELNRLANSARNNQLKPDEIQDGTFTITNFGTFKNLAGTPIINQPQVAILAIGAIEKKPAVLETPQGDVIAIRYKMFLSLTYDHRIIDGSLGGSFLRKVGDYIESFNISRKI